MSDFKFSTEPFLDSDQAAAILRIHPKPFNASRGAVRSPTSSVCRKVSVGIRSATPIAHACSMRPALR
jgi:hypothetical protein